MDKITHKVRREQWLDIINECLSSGMSKTVWCKEYGISDKTCFYWQRELREDVYISTIESASLQAVKDNNAPTAAPIDFVKVKIQEQPSTVSTYSLFTAYYCIHPLAIYFVICGMGVLKVIV